MAAPKYLKQASGSIEEVVAATTGGAPDAEKIPSLDANGRLTAAMMPVGIGAEVKVIVASEALGAGDFVNIWDDSGTLKARLADASADKPAHGYVIAAVESAANATVYCDGINDQLTGMSGGPLMYLSGAVPGAPTATPPSTSGHYVQRLGARLSATELAFVPDLTIIKLA
jgi:hypothetical protein